VTWIGAETAARSVSCAAAMDGGEAEAAAGGDTAFDAVTARLLGLTVLSPSEAEPAAGDGAEEAAPGDGDAEDALDGASDGDDGGGSEADEAEEDAALPGAAVASPADRSASLRAARATVRGAWTQRARRATACAWSDADPVRAADRKAGGLVARWRLRSARRQHAAAPRAGDGADSGASLIVPRASPASDAEPVSL